MYKALIIIVKKKNHSCCAHKHRYAIRIINTRGTHADPVDQTNVIETWLFAEPFYRSAAVINNYVINNNKYRFCYSLRSVRKRIENLYQNIIKWLRKRSVPDATLFPFFFAISSLVSYIQIEYNNITRREDFRLSALCFRHFS